MSDPLWGIDAHADYQPGLNVDSVKSEGYSFLVAKITEGTTYTAPQENFDWISHGRDIGLVVGGYHYVRSGSGVDQAHHFLDALGRVGGASGLIIQADSESDGSLASLSEFVYEVKANTGNKTVCVYTGKWWWPGHTNDADGTGLGPLWHSRYVSGTGYGSTLYGQVTDQFWTPEYGHWSEATILQFSSQGTVGGITGNVDVDAFRGSLADLQALAGTSVTPPPPPPPAPPAPADAYYVVQSGDTLSGIANHFGTTWQNLAAINHLSNPDLIYPGQALLISGHGHVAHSYTVQGGDTLSGIAAQFGTTWQTLANYNGLGNPDLIYPGQQILIP